MIDAKRKEANMAKRKAKWSSDSQLSGTAAALLGKRHRKTKAKQRR